MDTKTAEVPVENGTGEHETNVPSTLSAMAKTTTISTIAVQSGKTRIVIALLHVGDWIHLKILEITPELTTLGETLAEALELQKAHDEVLRQLQNKQSPVEELLRQADQLIATQKPRAEVYAAMAESLGRAWRDINSLLDLRKQILDLNVQYHTRASDFFDRMNELEASCSDTIVPIEVDAVKEFLTNIHDLRRCLLESLMSALQAGNSLLGKLKELGAEGTLDSRPDRIRTSVNRAISQVQGWLDELHVKRQFLEVTFNRRKTQLEQCLALAILAADLRELEEVMSNRRELLNSTYQLGDSSSSAELLQHEHRKLLPEAKQLQERALKITKATEQLVASGCFAGEQATAQAYGVLSATSDYLADLQARDLLLNRVIAFFRSAQAALTKLDQIEVQLTTSELPSTSPQLIQLHAQCDKAIDEITSAPIAEGHAILDSTPNGTEGVKRIVEELENRKISLSGLCVAHREENMKINRALNNFIEKHAELSNWLINVAEAFLQGHQDMGNNLPTAKDFSDLHNQLLGDLQIKGNEINTLLLTLPPILEYLEDEQRRDVDRKVEELHERWMKLKTILENRLDLARLYVKFHAEAEIVDQEMDKLESSLKNRNDIDEESLKQLEDKWESLVPLYQSAKNTGLTFISQSQKVSEPYLNTKRACKCVESVLERLADRQLVVTRNWQSLHTEVVQKRELLVRLEQTMAESTKTISLVSKLDSQLYPVITTDSTTPREIAIYLQNKLDSVLPDIKKAQSEVEQRIKTAEELIAKAQPADEKALTVKNKLSELNQKLVEITTEYRVLLEVLITYFNNLSELDKTTASLNAQFDKAGYPNDFQVVESLIREHEASKQAVFEMLKFSQNECDKIAQRISNQEPSEAANKDIEKLKHILEIRRHEWERQWKERRVLLESHRQLCQFNNDLDKVNSAIDDTSQQLQNIKGSYGDSSMSAKSVAQTFASFESSIKALEPRIKDFVDYGRKLLADQHKDSPHIEKQIAELEEKWENLKKEVANTKDLIDLNIEYFRLVDEVNEWFREGSRLLVTIARKTPSVKTPEEAQELINELETFAKSGEEKQNGRINQITDLTQKIQTPVVTTHTQHLLEESRRTIESFSSVREELDVLVKNLKTAEEQKDKLQKEQEEANAKLAAAKAEEAAAKAAAAAAEESKRAAEESKRAAEEQAKAIQEAAEAKKVEVTEKVVIHKIEIEKEGSPVRIEELQKDRTPDIDFKDIQKEKTPDNVVVEEVEEEAPRFTTPLSDAVIQEGSKFTFMCHVTGYPTPDIIWYKDGIPIENNPDYQTTYDDGLCSLTIEETLAEDTAKYTCKATNKAGVAETNATLSVKEVEPEEQLIPPTFVKMLDAATVKEGSTFQFQCKVEGNPLPEVQWYKNVTCIDDSPQYSITYNNGEAILKFEKISLDDKDDYTCKASNELGIAQTTASLNVTPAEPTEAPKFKVPLSNVMARAGQKIKLGCEVSGLPMPTITWSHNGKAVKETRELKLQYEGDKATLVILEAFPKDAGTYSVTAKNVAGEATCASNVSVKGRLPNETSDSELASDMEPIKPSIQLPLSDVTVPEGKSVRLDCVIVGQPEPEVIWYHNDQPVKESSDFQLLFQGDRCTLVIQEAFAEDAGEYKVVALNSAGEASSKCVLTVTPGAETKGVSPKPQEQKVEPSGAPPKFTKLLADVLVSEGDKVVFEGNVTGEPRPEIKWLLNNNPIPPSDHIETTYDNEGNIKLEIEAVKPEDKGVYTVKASNPTGDAKCFAQLIVKSFKPQETVKHEEVKSAPVFKELFSDKIAFENTSTKFECIVVGKPTPKVRWLFNGEPISGKDFLISTSGDRQVLSIPEVHKENAGTITCVAENEVGKASCAATLSVQSVSEVILPETQLSKQSQQHTESSYIIKKEVHTESSSSALNKVSTTTPQSQEPHVEVHTYKAQDAKTFKQVNQEPMEMKEVHKVEEFHQVDKEKPVISEKYVTNIITGGDMKMGEMKSIQQEVTQRPSIKSRPPRFVTPVVGKIVDMDAEVLLEGILDGQPAPTVTWSKNGEPLQSNDNLSISYNLNRTVVHIKKTTQAEAGRYTCTAVNEAGTAISTADLVVRKTIFPPVFGKRLQAQVIKKGDRIIMEVEVTGTPEPTISWFKDGNPITEGSPDGYKIKSVGNSHSVIIEKADLNHNGRYMVRAVNSGGEAQSIADIAVFEPTPDTMMEVVKTVVFEDVRKHETLTSASEKISSSETTTKPISTEIPKPSEIKTEIIPTKFVETSEDKLGQSLSAKAEYSSILEQKTQQEVKKVFLEHKTPDIPSPKPIEPRKIESQPQTEITLPQNSMETVSEERKTVSDETGIETSSISKQSSLQYFVKKIKQEDEPLGPPKEITIPEQIKPEIYQKFEDTTQKKEIKHERFESPRTEMRIPLQIDRKPEAPQYKPYAPEYQTYSSTQRTMEEFTLKPEPPAQICYPEETTQRESFMSKTVEETKSSVPSFQPVKFEVRKFEPSKPFSTSNEPIRHFEEQKSFSTEKTDHSIKTTASSYSHSFESETRTFPPKPSETQKLWVPHKEPERPASVASSLFSTSEKYIPRPLSAQSGLYEPSTEALAMEKQWAHKFSETHMEKTWPPPQQEQPKIQPSWSVQSTLEKKWTPAQTKQTETVIRETRSISQPQPTYSPVPHYIAEVKEVTHKSNLCEQKESSFSKTQHYEQYYSGSQKDHILEEPNAKPSEIIKSWPPAPQPQKYEPPPVKPAPFIETLPIRPVSVQDITDEVYLEPGPPPEIGYAHAPSRENHQSYIEQNEYSFQKSMKKEPERAPTRPVPPPKEKYIPPPPLPPKKEQPLAPPIPAKTFRPVHPPKKVIEAPSKPFQKFPDLEPFPYKPGPEKPRPPRVGPPPTPSKFVKGKFTDSDYESDFESARIPPKWKPYASDTEEPSYRRVRAPQTTPAKRSHSTEREPLPPSRFDHIPQISGPPRPHIDFEACRQKKQAEQIRKQTKHFTKMHEMRKAPSPPPIKPGTPPEIVEPEKRVKFDSPKIKRKITMDGYMADTDEPFIFQQQQKKFSKSEEKSEYKQFTSTETFESSQQKTISQKQQKFPPQKRYMPSAPPVKKELVATPIITKVSSEHITEQHDRHVTLEPFPFKPEPSMQKKPKGPPPPSPSKFVKGEFKESDYESDYEGKIQSIWRPAEPSAEPTYKPIRPVLSPSRQSHQSGRTPTPPMEFDHPPHIEGPPRPKFQPIEKPKPCIKPHVAKSAPKPTVFRPKPVPATQISDVIVATPAVPKPVILEPGTPPEIGYAPGPTKTQYYKSTTSTPYHNAVQTETSNIVHFNESNEKCHRTVSVQQTRKVITFGDKTKKEESTEYYQQTPKRQFVPPPPTPKKFIPGEFRESDYESEVEHTRIKPKWTPGGRYTEDLHYRKVRPPSTGSGRSSSVPPSPARVLTPMEFDTQPPFMPSSTDHIDSEIRRHDTYKRFSDTSSKKMMTRSRSFEPPVKPQPTHDYTSSTITKSTATKMASEHMDSMTQAFKSKTQKFVNDIMSDVNKQKTCRPILKTTEDGDGQVYREETRAAQYGTKHVDPDTGLIYFKYDFGYEFGIVLPGESKKGEIPVPKKTIIEPPKRSTDIEMPVYHETTKPTQNCLNPPTPQFHPKKFTGAKNVKWEPTSESEMSEYEVDGKKYNAQGSRWEQSSCSPMSLSPSLPSTSPAFNATFAGGRKGVDTPPSCPSTPGSTHGRIPPGQARPPMFITPLRDIAVVSGQAAKFECIVQSEPPPSILWSKNGRIIQDSREYQIHYRNGVCRLTISQAYPEDAGTYSCTATNPVGTVSTTATLQVPGERRSTYLK